MSKTLLNFIETNKKKGFLFWLNYILTNLNLKKEEQIDNSWKGLKLSSSYIPEGWTKENCFKHLNEHYQGKIMVAYKD